MLSKSKLATSTSLVSTDATNVPASKPATVKRVPGTVLRGKRTDKPVTKAVSGTTSQRAAASKAAKPGKSDGEATAAKPSGNVTRTAATIAKAATNFGGLSDRDSAYITFYAGFAKRNGNKPITIADIHAAGTRPAYNGSNKPHDAGVIVRLGKAGLITASPDGSSFTFTKLGTSRVEYGKAS